MGKAHVIVCGNEKGGSGKSTTAMHIAVGLMRLGYRVGTIDLDCHQASFTHYTQNRLRYMKDNNEVLPCSEHILLEKIENRDTLQTQAAEQYQIDDAIQKLSVNNDIIIIDTPGSDRYLSIMGHSYADTLVTPMNDSFVDLDLIAKIDPQTYEMTKTSIYTDMVHDLRRQRQKKDGHVMKWVLMRNRLSHLNAQNKHDIGQILENISPELGFNLVQGFGERVIFREMFLKGMTLLDLKSGGRKIKSLSNLTARQEVRALIKAIIPDKSVSTLSLLKTA